MTFAVEGPGALAPISAGDAPLMEPVGMPDSRDETGPILPLLALARMLGTLPWQTLAT